MASTNEQGEVSVAEWLEGVREGLPSTNDLALGPDDERELLDLARIAAHRSERIAAPLTTFLVGVALADLPAADRTERIARLKARLSEA